MKIAVFGGSFNPLHISHAMLADTVVKELGYDKVIFVPTFIPPHKIIKSNVTAVQRMEMLQAFCKSEKNSHFEVDSCEIDRGGVSYTSDTLEFLTQKYKNEIDGKLAFIMGDEIAAEFDKWRNPDKIVELADLIITHRYPDLTALEQSVFDNVPTGDYKGDFSVQFDINTFKYPCRYLNNPILPVSSTEIRARIAENKSFRYLVPEAVYNYIVENKLYL